MFELFEPSKYLLEQYALVARDIQPSPRSPLPYPGDTKTMFYEFGLS